MALTKVARQDLLAIVSVSASGVSVGTALDVSTYYEADLNIRLGRGSGTAFTVAPKVRIEASYINGTPNANQWTVVKTFQTQLGSSVGSQSVSSGGGSGSSAVVLAAGTNFAAGDYVFFHNGTIGSSEWSRVVSISSATLTLEEGLVNSQASSAARNQAEQYHLNVNLVGVYRLRAVVVGGDQTVIAHVDMGAVSAL